MVAQRGQIYFCGHVLQVPRSCGKKAVVYSLRERVVPGFLWKLLEIEKSIDLEVSERVMTF